PGGIITDPAPWPGTGGGWHYFPRPWPIVDPAPSPWFGGGWGRSFPTPFVDPSPSASPLVFPACFFQQQNAAASAALGRIGRIADPPPQDFSRFTAVQLESALHNIAAEKARLDSMEQMVKKQLEAAKKQQQPG